MVKTQSPITYKIEDLDGELVSGTFYSQELQLVEKEQIFEIESIIDRRKRKIGKKLVKEIKVHWKGYPSKFDSWILTKSKRKAMNRNWCNQKANPALNTKAGNK